MGCKLASFGFDVTAHDAYVGVQDQLDRTHLEGQKDDFSFVKTATDDVLVAIKAHKSKPKLLFSRVSY